MLTILFVLFGVGAGTGGWLFCKIFAVLGAIGLHYYSSPQTFFYYRNAGLSIRRLYGYTLLIDLGIFIIIALPLNLIAHAAAHFKG
ncbi:hypothetical protein A0256_18700 [Mucilaginibacter sp. PAMC 26640]|nr:hypothetical protein A0256_18700 [Mucilaginibacter sp. PAMC 26640]